MPVNGPVPNPLGGWDAQTFLKGVALAATTVFGFMKWQGKAQEKTIDKIFDKLDKLGEMQAQMATRVEITALSEKLEEHIHDHLTGQFGRRADDQHSQHMG